MNIYIPTGELKRWLCDACRRPSRKRWAVISAPWTLKGHKYCMQAISDCLEMPQTHVLTRLDFRMKGAPSADPVLR